MLNGCLGTSWISSKKWRTKMRAMVAIKIQNYLFLKKHGNFRVTHKSQVNTHISNYPEKHILCAAQRTTALQVTESPHPWSNVCYTWANLSFCPVGIWFWGARCASSDCLTRGTWGNSAFGWTEPWSMSTFVMQKMSSCMLKLVNRAFGSLLSCTRTSCSK